MLNKIVIMGRLTRDPELRRTNSGKGVASFSVAVERDYRPDGGERETDFIDCVAWDKLGEFVCNYFAKGRMIAVVGRLQIRSWKTDDGGTRRAAEIVAEKCYFGDTKREEPQAAPSQFTRLPDDTDVPFTMDDTPVAKSAADQFFGFSEDLPY